MHESSDAAGGIRRQALTIVKWALKLEGKHQSTLDLHSPSTISRPLPLECGCVAPIFKICTRHEAQHSGILHVISDSAAPKPPTSFGLTATTCGGAEVCSAKILAVNGQCPGFEQKNKKPLRQPNSSCQTPPHAMKPQNAFLNRFNPLLTAH